MIDLRADSAISEQIESLVTQFERVAKAFQDKTAGPLMGAGVLFVFAVLAVNVIALFGDADKISAFAAMSVAGLGAGAVLVLMGFSVRFFDQAMSWRLQALREERGFSAFLEAQRAKHTFLIEEQRLALERVRLISEADASARDLIKEQLSALPKFGT